MYSRLMIKILSIFALLLLGACQSKEVNPLEEARNPYAQFGVEGYMGATMTSCLGMPPSGPPIQKRKSKGTIFNEQSPAEQADYFDCIDNEMFKLEKRKSKDRPD